MQSLGQNFPQVSFIEFLAAKLMINSSLNLIVTLIVGVEAQGEEEIQRCS
jgi:hypothetical protein